MERTAENATLIAEEIIIAITEKEQKTFSIKDDRLKEIIRLMEDSSLSIRKLEDMLGIRDHKLLKIVTGTENLEEDFYQSLIRFFSILNAH
ncbi:MAG: hypothetical protein WC458_00825 [Patescibacteria group bacterium]